MTDSAKPSPGALPRTPQQVASAGTVRTRSQQQLEALLKGMFDRLQDIVFGWSEGLPEADQAPFQEVVQSGRRHRSDLEASFGRSLANAFAALQPQAGGARGIDFSTLSLVRTEDMDVTVTVDSMVARARLKYAAPLGLLRRRYGYLFPKADVSESNMPLDPLCIASAFKEAIAPLEMDITQKIILLRAFQAQVLDYMGALLDEANEVFIGAGVLPDLKVAVAPDAVKKAKAAPPKPGEKPAAAAAAGKSGNTEEIFSFLQGVLGQSGAGVPGGPVVGGQYHGGQYVGGGGIGALPASVIGGSIAAVPMTPQHISPNAVVQSVETNDLVAKLSDIQQFQPKAPLAQDASMPTVAEVRTSIRDNLRSDEKSVEAINRGDEDVINLISMLFDFILDDDDLPTAMKALIGRLQIPLLKVAILDKSFFQAETHSARRLLNALAKAGIGWSNRDPGGDALYTQIERVVIRILNDFSDDLTLFDQLYEEFSGFYDQQKNREETVDKRTRETEEGRARAELARAMVQQTLNRRLSGKQLPPVVVRLLQDAWRNVLYINCLKEGTESESWRQAVKVVDAVIWSVLPQPGPEWSVRLQSLAPKLVNSLKKGLAGVHYDSLQTEALLRELVEVHAGFQKGESQRVVTIMDSRAAQEAPVAGQVSAADMTSRSAATAETVVLPEAEAPPPAHDTLPDDSEYVVMVNRLNVGSWIEFVDGDKVERHKLVARIRSVDKLIFANRRGVKVAEMAGMKLALDLSLGRARLVQESQLIDRALESMIGSLRNLGANTASLQGASA